jgi:hypothetical protein
MKNVSIGGCTINKKEETIQKKSEKEKESISASK